MRPTKKFLALAILAALPLAAQTQPEPKKDDKQPDSSFSAAPAPLSATAPAPLATSQPKTQPMAKTQVELDAYTAAVTKPSVQEAEAAVAEFITANPDSELHSSAWTVVMQRYQQVDQSDKVVEIGEKIIALEPGNPRALVMTATIYAQNTRDTDVDRDERFDKAIRYVDTAVQGIDTELAVTSAATPEQIAALKANLVAMAYSAKGFVLFKRRKFADAEGLFKSSIEAQERANVAPDSFILARLATAQHMQSRYEDALATVDRFEKAAQSENNKDMMDRAAQHRASLLRLIERKKAQQSAQQNP